MGSTGSVGALIGFSRRIHAALRNWHTQSPRGLLDDLFLTRRIRAEREGISSRLITNQILLNGIDRQKQTDDESADLLKLRFLDLKTAREVAYLRNLSEDIVFQRQRAAIAQLAGIILTQENELRQQQRLRIEMRLEPPTYTQLFGVAEKLAEARALLETTSEPWLLSLEGLGGIGKTSLADALARELAGGSHFHEIAWISARRRFFQLSGDIETLSGRAVLTLGELVDRCVEQFELTNLSRRSDTEKLAGLKAFLKAQACLVILDNLETVADCYALVSQLTALVNPSKVLITTRHSLRDVSGVSPLPLKQLSRNDTFALIRHEAQTRGLPELSNASAKELTPLYRTTGGNPLATKLIVGQIHTLSLPMALSRFSAVKDKSVEKMLSYLYETVWQALDSKCRRVLQALLFVAEDGGRIDQIAATAELDESIVASCLHRLATLSLVNIAGNLQEKRYSLHQLTQVFVAQQSVDDNYVG